MGWGSAPADCSLILRWSFVGEKWTTVVLHYGVQQLAVRGERTSENTWPSWLIVGIILYRLQPLRQALRHIRTFSAFGHRAASSRYH